jgi:hypothetical protein
MAVDVTDAFWPKLRGRVVGGDRRGIGEGGNDFGQTCIRPAEHATVDFQGSFSKNSEVLAEGAFDFSAEGR